MWNILKRNTRAKKEMKNAKILRKISNHWLCFWQLHFHQHKFHAVIFILKFFYLFLLLLLFCFHLFTRSVAHARSSICHCDFIRFRLYFLFSHNVLLIFHFWCLFLCFVCVSFSLQEFNPFVSCIDAEQKMFGLDKRTRATDASVGHAVSVDKMHKQFREPSMDDGIFIVTRSLFFSLKPLQPEKNYERFLFFRSAIVAFLFKWI